jgi:DNA-binding NarL/FixJ family response regulator
VLRTTTSPSLPRLAHPSGPPALLTDREVEVVRLVVEGWTNPETAAQLVISPRTVQSHVASAMRKLCARSRTQLAVLALRRAVVPLLPLAPDDLAA